MVSSFVDQDARVECFTCETRTADFYGHSADENEAAAIAAWNTRATDAAIATDLSSPIVRASVIIAAPTLAAVLGIEGENG